MCRALLYLGEPVVLDNLLFQPDSALVRQSYMPKMLNLLNLAGFGLRAWDPASHAPAQPMKKRYSVSGESSPSNWGTSNGRSFAQSMRAELFWPQSLREAM